MSDNAALPVPTDRRQLATLDQLAAIPEEEIWLAKQKSKQTRRAYRLDVLRFMRSFGITTADLFAAFVENPAPTPTGNPSRLFPQPAAPVPAPSAVRHGQAEKMLAFFQKR